MSQRVLGVLPLCILVNRITRGVKGPSLGAIHLSTGELAQVNHNSHELLGSKGLTPTQHLL